MSAANSRYYFDCNALWKYYRGEDEGEKGLDNIEKLVSTSPHPIIISPLTQLEFFGRLMKSYRQSIVKHKKIHQITKKVRRDISIIPQNSTRYFLSVPFPEGIFRQAEGYLLQHINDSVGCNDTLHLSIVKKLQETTFPSIVMITSDRPLKNVCGKNGIPVYDPETD